MPISYTTDADTHDPNKILPIDYDWAREYYRAGVDNNWVPEEVPMTNDVQQWEGDDLSAAERQLIEWNLGFFSTAESLTANNIVLALYDHVTAPECRQYLLRQAYEEAIHTDTFIYCCDSLGFDPEYLYGMYDRVPAIEAKDEFVVDLTRSVTDPEFSIETEADVRAFLRDLVGFYVIMEGLFFYAGFAMMLGLKRQGKMEGVGEQFEYIMRDESLHLGFGVDLIRAVREETDAWTDAFDAEIRGLVTDAVDLERRYAREACPDEILGMGPAQFAEYVEYVADRRLTQLDQKEAYGTDNPFPWLSEAADLNREKNFFETQVTEYRSGGSLDW
ncbi:ribonucleotide-diphosphate reductase subunit beta [Candidatus Halobonum tyrrellensis]|uniref:Ribonucleotide-diphosphate reductase subunit beta n=1 Tax=Candidatus Halobonum tyrrellensis G22 TaxID=1324957 RepID=V4HJN6_9EURY|nr:ribonucleotide-diphosphate reductase subunit beta [Candidatus Halobonum tyrrellensis]ESP88129.1 ribonucleotide-diphosphate reductase subunit beta [Candidatus Halobonum tyrrellensis G22]